MERVLHNPSMVRTPLQYAAFKHFKKQKTWQQKVSNVSESIPHQKIQGSLELY